MIEGKVTLRPRYKETDQMGIVHHSNYVVYFEHARGEFMRELGMTYRSMEEQGIMMPVVDVQVHYKAPAYYDELLTISVRVEKMPMAKIEFLYEVRNEADKLLTTGSVTLGFMHSDTRKPCRAPLSYVQALKEAGLNE